MRSTHHSIRAVVAAVALSLAPHGAVSAQEPAPAPTTVDVAKPVEREIAAGQSHAYTVEVEAGEFFHADVEQHGVDVAVSIFDPAGAQLTEVDSLTGSESAESVSLVARAAGSYRFVVHVGADADPPSGKYVVVASPPRPATPKDLSLVEAEYAAHDGLALWLENTDEGRTAALPKYEAALAAYALADDARGQADSLSTAGAILSELNRLDEAVAHWERELPLRRAVGDPGGEAVAFNNIGLVAYRRADFATARSDFERGLAIAKAAGDKEHEAVLASRLGQTLSAVGRKREAVAALTEALPLLRQYAPPEEEPLALSALGGAYYDQGRRREALDTLEQALEKWRGLVKAGLVGPAYESETLIGAGAVYGSYGEREKALAYGRQALELSRSIDDKKGESRAYLLLGHETYELGDNAAAIESYTKALALAQAAGYRAYELAALQNLGTTYAAMREDPADDRRAIEYLTRALAGWRAAGDRGSQAETLVNLGEISVRRGAVPAALRTLTVALRLTRETRNRTGEAIALKLLGDAYRKRGDVAAALASYEAALPIAREARFAGGDATVLLGIATVERDRGRLEAARAKVEEAIGIVESVRSRVADSDLRASFFASARPYYDFYVDLLMRMHRRAPGKGYDAEALRASERAKARSLVELLATTGADVRAGLDPAVAAKLSTLRDDIDATTVAETHALASGDEETASATSAKLGELSDAYRSTLEAARAADPRFAELTSPPTLGLEEIRSRVLDDETALVEYFLGESRGYVWVATRDGLKSYSLPSRARVEAVARRVYGVLAGPGAASGRGLALAAAPETSTTDDARSARLEREYLAAAAPLSRMVLAPIANDLGRKRVLVVADGALGYVPFAALPFATGGSAPEPLVVTHEVDYAPSASTIDVLRRETGGRAPAPKLVALFADPVFDASDARVRKSATTAEPAEAAPAEDAASTRSLALAAAKQSAEEAGYTGGPTPFPRLPHTRDEVDAIAAAAPAGASTLGVDFAASRDAATSAEIGSYRIVHFATHGYLNSTHPELSGLVLSLCDERGRPTTGFLATPDVYDMRLKADLVVLSACDTGLGKEIRGEGIVGLTRAFMYAGAPRVVVSLWSVSDRATASLMTDLYRGMWDRRLAPSAALREAQLATWRQQRWRAPFYWAPFVLQGDWR